MKKQTIFKKSSLTVYEAVEGETIESKIERKVNNGEPMNEQGVGLLYTERSKGVLPETNIRTDRFIVAVEATEKIAASYQAKREERQGDGGTESTVGTDEPTQKG